jgi:hypothetical protein
MSTVNTTTEEIRMRASARATATVPRHLLEQRVEEGTDTTVVVLQELATALEDVLARVNELREQERTAAAA